MKCYVHQDVDAVGVCSVCGAGVCKECVVEIGGKLYCKTDADKVFGNQRPTRAKQAPVQQVRVKRAVTIAVASVLLHIYGTLALMAGALLLSGGVLTAIIGTTGSLASLTAALGPLNFLLGSVMTLNSGTIIAIGVVVVIISILNFVAGQWLWNSRRRGAPMAVFVALLGITLAASYLFSEYGAILFYSIPIDIVVIIMVGVGWRRLR